MNAMALHILKLCVGADSIEDLRRWIKVRLDEQARRGEAPEHAPITRMIPKRADELTSGGSLYWVIKGQIAARQALLKVRPFTDGAGVSRCHLVLEPKVVSVLPRPCRPFQGWRYLADKDAPPDLSSCAEGVTEMPEALRRDLRELGLL